MPALTLSRIGRFALDLLYPPSCALCGRGGHLVCEECWAKLPRAVGRRCGSCWLALSSGDCRHCASRRLAFRALRSLFRYEGDARKLVHKFKFGDFSTLAQIMAPTMADLIDWPVDGVVPVPLAASRARQRGYNQSRLLAEGIGKALEAPLIEALRREPGGQPQALSPNAWQRRRNVEGAFGPRRGAMVEGMSLLLVDDVATTGATLDACARSLLGAGALEVTAVTFARED